MRIVDVVVPVPTTDAESVQGVTLPVTGEVAVVLDGPPGPPGNGVVPLRTDLVAQASATITHGRQYVPTVVVTNAAGAEVTVEVEHLPGQVHITMSAPFTGAVTIN